MTNRAKGRSRNEPLPLSGALKVLKRDLRAPYWEGKDRSVH
jgi:long-chain acyl-CoA synthetase